MSRRHKTAAREARAERWEYVHGRGCVDPGCPAREAVADATPSPRIVTRLRKAAERSDPRYRFFFGHRWVDRNHMRRAMLDRVGVMTLEQAEAIWAAEDAKNARRMARSLKRRRKVR